jgi:iron complex outermembrane receptor protein
VQIKIDDYHTLASTTPPARRLTRRPSVDVAGGKPKFDDALLNGGVIFEPWQGIRAYASYAEGFTVPDIGRITRAVNRTGVDIDTFARHQPDRLEQSRDRVEVKRGPLDASATYFWSSSDKGQLLIARPGGIFDVQRQRVEIQGLEVNLGVSLPIEGLRGRHRLCASEGRYDSDRRARRRSIPISTAPTSRPTASTCRLAMPRAAVGAGADQFYLSRTFHGKGTRTMTRATISAAITSPTRRSATRRLGGLSFSVQNLFDKQYIDYSSDTRLPTDNLSYFAGRGRTFTLGWDYRF